jgi:uncharacterized protein (TIGR03435 family)
MHRALAVVTLAAGAWGAFGQPASPLPEFEAVSIKPNKSGEISGGLRALPGGRVNATNVPLKVLIEWAYQVREFQISGEPGWVDSERFDVTTKANGNLRTGLFHPELETMFQAVLADRFQLALHKNTKEMPVFSLLVAKNGTKIHPADDGDCPDIPPSDNTCRSLHVTKFAHVDGKNAGMRGLASILTSFMGKIVVDKTDLKGSYTFSLDWAKFLQPPELPPGAAAPPGAFDPASVGPAIGEALQEQLGLKLESGKGPVEILVIDHVERPSEN